MDDKWFVIGAIAVLICFTAGAMQSCHYDHEVKLKCIEKGWHYYPNGQCEPEAMKNEQPKN